jgi:hypothetical protein
MRISRTFAAVAAVGLLAAPFAMGAGAKKVHQEGSVKGDSGASAQLVLLKSGSTLKSVKNIRFKDLRTECDSGKARITLKLSGAAKIDENRTFKHTYLDGKSKIKLEGKVKSDGSRVHGSIKGTTIRTDGLGRCDVPSIEFTTKR